MDQTTLLKTMRGTLWVGVSSVVKPGHLWIDFIAIFLGATNNVSTGECNSRLPLKLEWVLWGEIDPVFHYWQHTLLIECFPLSFGLITSIVNIMRYVQPCEVAQAIQLLQDGSSVRMVARRFGISQVLSLVLGWNFKTGQYSRGAGQGRRRATTHRQDMYLVLSARRFRQSPARSLQSELQRATGVKISDQTVRNRLHSSELRSRRPFVFLIATPRHSAVQRAFATDHQNWQVRHWLSMLFTNESGFNVSRSNGRVRV